VDEYPTTASGKIQKYKLRESATKELKREEDATIQTA
jgi:fatty-acyl-CoA synthase